MLTLLAGGVAGISIGLVRGGTLSAVAELRLRARLWPCLAVLVQMTSGVLPADRRFLAIDATYALLAIWLYVNAGANHGRLRVAFGLLTAGWTLNTLAIVLNRGMPVSLRALHLLGAPPGTSLREGHLFKHVAAGGGSKLSLLGDVIPIPPLRSVISVGDVVMILAVATLLATAMTRRELTAAPHPEPTPVGAPSAPVVRSDRDRLDVGHRHETATRPDTTGLRGRIHSDIVLIPVARILAWDPRVPRPVRREIRTSARTE